MRSKPFAIFLFLLIALFFYSFSLPVLGSKKEGKIVITPEEQQFIKDHPVIRLGGGESFDPFIMQYEDGTVEGFDVDTLNLISEKTGLKFEFQMGNWKEIQQMAYQKKIDGITAASRNKEREAFFISSDPYIQIESIVMVKKGNPKKIYRKEHLFGKKAAVQRGNMGFETFTKEVSQHRSDLIYKDSIYDLMTAVVSGEADYMILDESIFYLARKMGFSNLIEVPFTIDRRMALTFQVRKDWPEAVSLMNKGLKAIRESQRVNLRDRWFRWQAETIPVASLTLPTAYRTYLKKRGPIRYCINPQWMPFEKIDQNGVHKGVSKDYLDLLNKRLGVKAELYHTGNWHESIEAARAGECDLIPFINQSEARSAFLDFTTPYISFPYVIAVTHDKLFIEDIEKVLDKTFAVIKGAITTPVLKQKYPGIKLVEADTVLDLLELVQKRAVFGAIDATVAIGYNIQKEGFYDLKIGGKLPLTYDIGIAVRKGDSKLLGAYQRAVGSLKEVDHQEIKNRWLSIKFEQKIDYRLLWKIMAVTGFVFILFFLWFWQVHCERKKSQVALLKLSRAQKKLRRQNEEKKELVRILCHDLMNPIGNIDAVLDLIEDDFSMFEKLAPMIRSSIRNGLSMINLVREMRALEDGKKKLKIRSYNLFELVMESKSLLFQKLGEKNIDFELDVEKSISIQVEKTTFINSVLNNLISNAIKFSYPEGKIQVSATRENGQVQLKVRDYGIGIPKALVHDLFDISKPTTREGTQGEVGTGYGMPLVKKYMEMFEGRVEISSKEKNEGADHGTEICLSLNEGKSVD